MIKRIRVKLDSWDLRSLVLTILFLSLGAVSFLYFTNIRDRWRTSDELKFRGQTEGKIIEIGKTDQISQSKWNGTKIYTDSYKVTYRYNVDGQSFQGTDIIPLNELNRLLLTEVVDKRSGDVCLVKFDINEPSKSLLVDMKYRDSSVSGIKLRNSESVEKMLGRGRNYQDPNVDETQVVNADGRQILTMIFYPGGTVNEVYAFRVSYNTENIHSDLKLAVSYFESGRKIKLGLTVEEVKSKLGTPSKVEIENGLTIWTYKSEIKDDLYFGRYDFRDEKLVQFWFGEEYP
ncbi:MAG: hypothetical protein QM762_04515 [Chryseolinea sp.]